MLDLTHLSHLLAVAQHGSFRRAAAAVHLSQSALSRSIQALEAAIGRPLIVRARTGIELTPHGRVVLEHAEILLRERQRLLDDVERLDDPSQGELRIGLAAYPAELSGIEAAARLCRPGGPMPFVLRIGDFRQVTEDLRARRIDMGFCDIELAKGTADIHCRAFPPHMLFPYTRPGHPLLGLPRATFEAVFSYPTIGIRSPERHGVPIGPNAHFDPLTGERLPAMNTANPSQVLRLLLHTDAVGLAPLVMIEDLLAAGQVALVPVRLPQIALHPGIITLNDREPSALARRYIDEVSEVEEEVARRNREVEARYGVAG